MRAAQLFRCTIIMSYMTKRRHRREAKVLVNELTVQPKEDKAHTSVSEFAV